MQAQATIFGSSLTQAWLSGRPDTKTAQTKLAFYYTMKAVLPQNALQADVQKQCSINTTLC